MDQDKDHNMEQNIYQNILQIIIWNNNMKLSSGEFQILTLSKTLISRDNCRSDITIIRRLEFTLFSDQTKATQNQQEIRP